MAMTDVWDIINHIEHAEPESLRALAFAARDKADGLEISRSLEGRIATALHDSLCYLSHEDQCGWFREENGCANPWTRYSHETWRLKARRLLRLGGYEHKLIPDEQLDAKEKRVLG